MDFYLYVHGLSLLDQKKIKINTTLYERAKKATEKEGYSSLEEFITTIIEKALSEFENPTDDQEVIKEQL